MQKVITMDRTTMQQNMERHHSFYEFIMETAKTDPLEAANMMMTGLMRGDRESLKLGYSIGNALVFTLEQIPLTADEIGVLIERVAIPKPGIVKYGPTPR